MCQLKITFANSLDPDQAGQNIGPDLNPICFDTLIVFLKEFFENADFEKKSADNKNIAKLPTMQRVNPYGF